MNKTVDQLLWVKNSVHRICNRICTLTNACIGTTLACGLLTITLLFSNFTSLARFSLPRTDGRDLRWRIKNHESIVDWAGQVCVSPLQGYSAFSPLSVVDRRSLSLAVLNRGRKSQIIMKPDQTRRWTQYVIN
jgi:hypothetical protein